MKRGIWLVVIIVIIAGAIWGWSKFKDSTFERALAAIESMEDPGEKMVRAKTLLLENQDLEGMPLWRLLGAGIDAAEELGGAERRIAFCESLAAMDLAPKLHAEVLSGLHYALAEADAPQYTGRANEVAREILNAEGSRGETYRMAAWYQADIPTLDKKLGVEIANKGYRHAEEDEKGMWYRILDMSYRAYLGSISETQSLDRSLAVADSMLDEADDPIIAGVLEANRYRLAVEMDEDTAVAAAQGLAELERFNSWRILNDVSYDMAERELEPDLAIVLAERALSNTTTRRDSGYVFDTVGWAYYAAGDYERAVDNLEKSLAREDETVSYASDIVQHLIAAYKGAGDQDSAIDLLSQVLAKSVETEDGARGELSGMLMDRDGTDSALDQLVMERRYAGVEYAPDFELPSRSGGTVRLSDLKGDIAVVNFWGFG